MITQLSFLMCIHKYENHLRRLYPYTMRKGYVFSSFLSYNGFIPFIDTSSDRKIHVIQMHWSAE